MKLLQMLKSLVKTPTNTTLNAQNDTRNDENTENDVVYHATRLNRPNVAFFSEGTHEEHEREMREESGIGAWYERIKRM